jgi:hypothetical protein
LRRGLSFPRATEEGLQARPDSSLQKDPTGRKFGVSMVILEPTCEMKSFLHSSALEWDTVLMSTRTLPASHGPAAPASLSSASHSFSRLGLSPSQAETTASAYIPWGLEPSLYWNTGVGSPGWVLVGLFLPRCAIYPQDWLCLLLPGSFGSASLNPACLGLFTYL